MSITRPSMESSHLKVQSRRKADEPLDLYTVEKSFREGNEDELDSDSLYSSDENGSPPANGGRRTSNIAFRPSTFQLNQNEISIQVELTVSKGEKSLKHALFTLRGYDSKGEFETFRTSDQFQDIRSLLIARWPGCYIPALPPKRLMTKQSSSFLEQRRKQFEMFCQKMSDLPFLQYSEEYQIFLKSASADISSELQRFRRIDYHEILLRFGSTFPQALENEATNKAFEKIENFREFLISVKGNFSRYKKALKGIVKARQAYIEQFALLQETMCTDFERKVLSEYQNLGDNRAVGSDNYIIETKEKVMKLQQTGQTEPLEYLHAWIKLEAREIEAFLEAIGQRDKYVDVKGKIIEKQRATVKTLDRVLEGKVTMKTMLSTKSRDTEADNLEREITNCKKDAEFLNILIEKITLVLAYSEIEKFKKNKADQYHHVITMAARNELVKLRDMSDFWGILAKIKETKHMEDVTGSD